MFHRENRSTTRTICVSFDDAIEGAQSRTFRETHKEKVNLYCACALVVRVMASLRQILRKNDFSDDDSQTIAPEKRCRHECALVDDHLHLFGGRNGLKFFPRNEIFVMNVRRAEKKWIRRLTRGRTIPPPCEGARCVVIDKMIYSYGGWTDKSRCLGIVYRLDPKRMEWIEIATPFGGKKPHERSYCSLCAIGSRMIMFGGLSEKKIPRDQLQSGATQDKHNWSNDIYEFQLEERNEKGDWI